jgi:hypothetical protein
MFQPSKLLRVSLIIVCILAVALGFIVWSWYFTTSRLHASAQSFGIFPSPSEGMLMLVQSDYIGIQEARIVGVYPETFPLGGGSHVWFVTVCVWADSREDGSPVGHPTSSPPHDFDFGGSYFVDTHEGWVMMPESSFPLFVGFWMPIFDLAGDDSAQPFHDPSAEPKQPCVR